MIGLVSNWACTFLWFSRRYSFFHSSHYADGYFVRSRQAARSIDGVEFHPSGFGQQHDSEDHESVGGDREHGDRVAQRHRRAEIADQRGKDSAEGPSKTVGETLARAAEAGGEKFREECTDRAEYARGEESKRESQREHRAIANRQVGVRRDGDERGHSKQNERRLATDTISKVGADQVADQRARYYNTEISAGNHSRNVELTVEKGWQPRGDGVITALCSDRHQGGQGRDSKDIGAENFQKSACMVRHHGLASLAVYLWLSNISANIHNE
jgi:hypothetical protein